MTDFEKIYKTYFHAVFLYAKKNSKDDHLAEELTSETFLKAMESLDRFRGDCDIRVWLCQIAKNCYCSYLKKQKRVIALEQVEDPVVLWEQALSPEEAAAGKDDTMRLYTMLHCLQEPYKEVFMLRVFGELGFRQIGGLFGKTENWACVTYHRACSKIKERMEESP